MKPLVLYHGNCWDGFCAAWVVRKALGEIDARPVQYGRQAPSVTGRTVYVVDFSYPRATLERMAQQAGPLVVLDHHKTAQADLVGLEYCRFDMNKSGGRLAWEYFFPDQPSPWLVDYTEDRDLWRHALAGTEAINAALRSYPLSFELWDEFDARPDLSSFVLEGTAIRRSEQAIVAQHVRNAHKRTIDGYDVLAVNATVLFSEIAGELARNRPFGACYFETATNERQWSLRSREGGIDVSVVAKNHGGGGHAQAAGYTEKL